MYSSSNEGGPEIALIKNEKNKSLELCIDSLRNFICELLNSLCGSNIDSNEYFLHHFNGDHTDNSI